MCGIYCSTLSFSEEVVSKKLERIKFRGPDYTGILRKDDIIFGHNRLSIIDLDERANQPFVYDTLVIVFNGEIYNFENLRFELVKKGYEFHTNSDTEVLCAMYKEYGIDMLGRLNGMFAFVIYDSVNSILLSRNSNNRIRAPVIAKIYILTPNCIPLVERSSLTSETLSVT